MCLCSGLRHATLIRFEKWTKKAGAIAGTGTLTSNWICVRPSLRCFSHATIYLRPRLSSPFLGLRLEDVIKCEPGVGEVKMTDGRWRNQNKNKAFLRYTHTLHSALHPATKCSAINGHFRTTFEARSTEHEARQSNARLASSLRIR